MSEIKKINGKNIKDETARNDIEDIKESYAKKEYVDNAIEEVDITYAKKTDIPIVPTNVSELTNDSGYLTSIPSEYITETELNSKGYLTSIPSEYITETELNAKNYLTSIPNEYITETELNNKGYLTQHQDLSTYAKKTDIPTVTNDLTNALKSNYDSAYTHSTSTHAPSNAQKNSDITKAEIEAKLTGSITSHSHNYLTSSDMIARDRVHTSLIPSGTSIPANTDLNTIDYIKVGSYFCSKNVDAKTLLNCPTEVAFMMEVSSPLSTTYDNETANAWVYRLRTITVHNTGEKYIQYVSSGSTVGEFTYKDWQKVAFTKEIPTSISQLTNDSGYTTTNAMNLALSNKVDKVDGKGLSTNDYTTTEKNKLSGIESGANKVTVYTANQCTTFTSDEGTCTPLAVQKAVGMFPPKSHQHTEYATQNDVANAKAENPYRKISHKGNATATWYYPLINFVKDNGANHGNFNISGRMGGWESWKVANYDILLVNRSGTFDGLTITSTVSANGEVATALETVDMEIFVQDDTSAIAYLKVNGYFLFDFSVMENQHTCIFDGTYLTEQPTGNLRWRLSDAKKTVLNANGVLSQTGYPNEYHDVATIGYLNDHKPHPGNYFVNGFAGMTADGVMEVGKYQDWHNTNDDTNDFSVRVMCDSSNQNTVKLPQQSGRLALEENIPTATSQLANDIGFVTRTDMDNSLSGKSDSGHNHDSRYYRGGRSTYDVDTSYDAYLYMTANGTNTPCDAPYGVCLSLPYRQMKGNKKPDFGGQIFIPNGDDEISPNSMFYRTSLGDTWNKWQEVNTRQTKKFTLPATAGWYRIAEAEVGNVNGRIKLKAENGNYACCSILDAVITKNKYPSLIPVAHSIYSSNSLSITQARIAYVSGSATEKSYLEVYVSPNVALTMTVTSENSDWQLIDPIAVETSPSGYGLFSTTLSYNINGYAKHDHTHHKVTAMSFDSEGYLSITIDGTTKRFKPV